MIRTLVANDCSIAYIVSILNLMLTACETNKLRPAAFTIEHDHGYGEAALRLLTSFSALQEIKLYWASNKQTFPRKLKLTSLRQPSVYIKVLISISFLPIPLPIIVSLSYA